MQNRRIPRAVVAMCVVDLQVNTDCDMIKLCFCFTMYMYYVYL